MVSFLQMRVALSYDAVLLVGSALHQMSVGAPRALDALAAPLVSGELNALCGTAAAPPKNISTLSQNNRRAQKITELELLANSIPAV